MPTPLSREDSAGVADSSSRANELSPLMKYRDVVFSRIGKTVGEPIVTHMPSQAFFRTAFAVAVASLLIFHKQLDAAVALLWEYLKQTWWFRHDSLEPVVATLSFFPPLTLFYILDNHVPSAKIFRFRKSDDMSHWNDYSGKSSFRGWPILVAYIAPIMLFDFFFPRRSLPEAAPTALGLVGQIIALLAVYDALFFLCHRGLHMNRSLFKHIHALHHQKPVTRALDAVRLTFTEEIIDVACSIVAVNLLRAHPLARATYNAIIVYLLVELHCGYDFPWMLHNLVPFKLMGGPPRHDAHHADGRHYFQKFFTYIDDFVGPIKKVPSSA